VYFGIAACKVTVPGRHGVMQIMWNSGVFVPAAPLMIDVLQQCAALSKPTSTSGKAPVFSIMLKLSKDSLASPVVQTALVRRALEVLLDTLRSQFTSIGFPELVRAPLCS
jgi:hypothetical protein